jgi:hypothetical protein
MTDSGEVTFLRATGTWHVSSDNLEVTFQDSSRPDEDTLYVYIGSKVCRDRLTFGKSRSITRINGRQAFEANTEAGGTVYVRDR